MKIHFPILTLTQKIIRHGVISYSSFGRLLIYYLKILLTLPFDLLQALIYGQRIRNTRIEHSPVFILGHYRSGTTLMHKMMAEDPNLGTISNFDILFPGSSLLLGKKMEHLLQKLINMAGIRNFHFNNVIHRLSEPGEEDMMMISSCAPCATYWGFLFPFEDKYLDDEFLNNKSTREEWKKSYFRLIRLATYKNGGRQLVLKNPPNTGRIRLLLELFPNAKFIYVHRNAFHLYFSMKNLWENVISKYYSLHKISSEQIDQIIFNHYEMLIGKYEKDKKMILPGDLVEVTFDSLENSPFETILDVYEKLGLPKSEFMETRLKIRISMESSYRKFSYNYSPEYIHKISVNWKNIIQQRGYSKPINHHGSVN